MTWWRGFIGLFEAFDYTSFLLFKTRHSVARSVSWWAFWQPFSTGGDTADSRSKQSAAYRWFRKTVH
jgi:hypothetical protein